MIAIESSAEGFVASVDGRRVIAHSRRSPCVELGRCEPAPRSLRGSGRPRYRREKAAALRDYKLVESAPDYAAIDFEGRLRMALRLKDGRLRISFSRYDGEVNLFRLRLVAWPEERVYGCGERGPKLDLKGERASLWVQGRGAIGEAPRRRPAGEGTHFPLPAFLSTQGYWCAIDTSAYAELDFRRKSATVLETWAVPREIVLGFGADAPAILADLTAVLGHQAEPPHWCYDGVCLALSGGEDEVERRLSQALDAGVKVAAVWLADCCGPRDPQTGFPPDWRRDRGLYPRLPELAERWHGQGIRCLGSIGPLLPEGGELAAAASAAKVLVQDPEGRDYALPTPSGRAFMVDLSGPEGNAWMKKLIASEFLGSGLSGWAADYGEQLPGDAVLASGEQAARVHNRWPVLWARACREAIEEGGRTGDAFFFLRSGWLGAGRQAPAFFAGERSASFSKQDGLPSLVPQALSLGLSGLAFCHSETGGSMSRPPSEHSSKSHRRGYRECLSRWMELSAFTPFFRLGGEVDPGCLPQLARMSEIFASLKPYHIAAAAEYSASGLPPIRHPWIHYPDDPEAYRSSSQYLYGRDLLVAPVLAPERELTDLYLPSDEWVHLWTSRRFRGGSMTIDSPIGYPAVFYRAGSSYASLFDAIRRTVKKA